MLEIGDAPGAIAARWGVGVPTTEIVPVTWLMSSFVQTFLGFVFADPDVPLAEV
jgi:hypothetical protein